MSYSGKSKFMTVLTVEGVDGKTTGATFIDKTGSDARFVPLFVNAEASDVSRLISVSSISVETNGASYNNISSVFALTGVTSVNTVFQNDVNSLLTSVPPSTDIYVNVSVGAVATTYNLRISVIGFYY